MAIPLSDNILTNAPKPSDARYGPWASVEEACAGVPSSRRYDGLTVMVTGAGEYWWLSSDLSDFGLIPKSTSSPGTPSPGTGFSFQKFTFDVPQAGANAFPLPPGASDVFPAVKVQQASPYPTRPTRILNDDHYRVENTQLLVSAAAGLGKDDTVIGTAILGTGSPGAGIDYNNVPQAAQDAVTDASNTWNYGDLTAYGSTDLETAALTDVVKGMYFDSFEQGSTTDAYRYCYCLQNDGTLGWTRLLKYS